MKGIIFSELIEMVEQSLSLDIADEMIQGAETSNAGAYTAVGTYDHAELIALIGSLSRTTSKPAAELVKLFGQHLFRRLHELYPQFFDGVTSAVDFLPSVEDYIHVEVRKLYPDAELPTFACESNGGVFQMTYHSTRPFADLAEGMILACVDHFEEAIKVTREDLGERNGTAARFSLHAIAQDVRAQNRDTCPT